MVCRVSPEQTTGEPAAVAQPPAMAASSGGFRLALASAGAAVVQGGCLVFMLANSLKAVLGLGSLAAAGGSSLIHSPPVQIPLMVFAAISASITLYVIWNGWRLRRRPEAQWRRRPLSVREKRMIALSAALSVAAWVLIAAEIVIHRILHAA